MMNQKASLPNTHTHTSVRPSQGPDHPYKLNSAVLDLLRNLIQLDHNTHQNLLEEKRKGSNVQHISAKQTICGKTESNWKNIFCSAMFSRQTGKF